MYQVLINGKPGVALAGVEDKTNCCFNTISQAHWYLREYFYTNKLPQIRLNAETEMFLNKIKIVRVTE